MAANPFLGRLLWRFIGLLELANNIMQLSFKVSVVYQIIIFFVTCNVLLCQIIEICFLRGFIVNIQINSFSKKLIDVLDRYKIEK